MRKCNLGFFALLLIAATSLFFTSCNNENRQYAALDANQVLGAGYETPTTDTFKFETIEAEQYEKTYKQCGSDSNITVARYRPIKKTIKVSYKKPGAKIDYNEKLKAAGAQLVHEVNTPAAPVAKPAPVDSSTVDNSSETADEAPSKPWDYSWIGNWAKGALGVACVIGAGLIAAAIILLLLWLLKKLIDALRSDSNNGGGAGNKGTVTEERTINTSRNGGANAYRGPGPNIKSRVVVIETKETITEEYHPTK